MPKRMVRMPTSGRVADLDLVSYGRRGPHTPMQFTATQIEQIERTVRGVPEVMIKVSGGGKSAAAVLAHLAYIDRHGKLEVLIDEGETLQGKGVAEYLVDDWNLEVGKGQYRPEAGAGKKDRRPKQVHNIVFSMPLGTEPTKLLAATQKFAREKFALEHRYAMVLHTDQEHPHVHLVVKAVSEQGQRLYIRKPTLREWRVDFAHYLRELGVAANATPSALRGRPKSWQRDGIYRALKRGQSTFMRRRLGKLADELQHGRLAGEQGKTRLTSTRERVVADWSATANVLGRQGQHSLAREVEGYLSQMRPAATDQELLAQGLLARLAAPRSRVAVPKPERAIDERTR